MNACVSSFVCVFFFCAVARAVNGCVGFFFFFSALARAMVCVITFLLRAMCVFDLCVNVCVCVCVCEYVSVCAQCE